MNFVGGVVSPRALLGEFCALEELGALSSMPERLWLSRALILW